MFMALPAYADATLTLGGPNGPDSTIFIRGDKGRISSADRMEYLLYDRGAQTIVFVEPAVQQYTRMTVAELEAMVQKAAMVKETVAPFMADLLAGLPEEQRAAIEQRIGGIPESPAAGVPAGSADIRTVARGKRVFFGLTCEAREIIRNNRPVMQVCMATGGGGQLSAADFSMLESLMDISRRVAVTAGSLIGDMNQPVDLLAADLQGVPLSFHDMDNGTRYQLTSINDAELSETLFLGFEKFNRKDMPVLLR
jgi:hypothetical protein